MEKIKVFIVDDHQTFRDGLKFLLSKKEKYEVIGEAVNGKEFLEKVEASKPDVVLMDISMPEMNGIEATKEVKKILPDLKILALSMFGDEEYYYKMIHAGVHGFILKEAGSKDLEKGLNEVINGDNYFSSELLQNIIPRFNTKENNLDKVNYNDTDKEILKQICSGSSSLEISKNLDIPAATVESTISDLLDKSNVTSTVDLIMHAIKSNLVEI